MLNWFTLIPLLALAAFGASFVLPIGMVTAAIAGLFLIAAVTASVHHAEVIASRVGEPFGTLVLALAITIIEVALIVSVMLAGGPEKAALPRDTIFAAIMLICTGVVGICMMVGGLSHREQRFQLDGAMAALAALITLAGVSLILPSFTTSSPEGTYTDSQLVMAAIASLVLWAVFVLVQTVRHRDYFLPEVNAANENVHAVPPTTRMALASLVLLLVSLVAVVGLAKQLSPTIEA